MVDLKGHMMFDAGMRYAVKDWWLGTIALIVLNIVGTIVFALLGEIGGILAMVWMLAIFWASLGLNVARLRDRGHTDAMAFVLRIIIFPWGLIECAFMGSAE